MVLSLFYKQKILIIHPSSGITQLMGRLCKFAVRHVCGLRPEVLMLQEYHRGKFIPLGKEKFFLLGPPRVSTINVVQCVAWGKKYFYFFIQSKLPLINLMIFLTTEIWDVNIEVTLRNFEERKIRFGLATKLYSNICF